MALESKLDDERRSRRQIVGRLGDQLAELGIQRKKDIALGVKWIRELSMRRSMLAMSIEQVVLPMLRDGETQYEHDARTRRIMEAVLEKCSSPMFEEEGSPVEDSEDAIARFKEFLDEVNPDDF
jgi:hypothetical protein